MNTQPTATAATLGAGTKPAPRRSMIRLHDLALLPALVILIIIGAFISPAFLTQGNINTILTSSAALALVVLAESLIIITGKFDLSLESTAGFAPAIGALLVLPVANNGFGVELPTFVGILIVIGVGALIGLINGILVVRFTLNAFIVTLAMLIILRGMLVGATSGRTLFDLPDAFYALMIITILGLPLAVWLAALAFIVAGIVLRYHRLG
ncbi:MAG TPA: ABC transporter permease, partial [Kaistia sp.]|nr:ABC transporter permease [Kaistia sp.]